ncbi:MAG: hypothetical protein IJA61_02350 [Clostridia bacterium]|nr:hypothetical protein [Clostridia bacterium]
MAKVETRSLEAIQKDLNAVVTSIMDGRNHVSVWERYIKLDDELRTYCKFTKNVDKKKMGDALRKSNSEFVYSKIRRDVKFSVEFDTHPYILAHAHVKADLQEKKIPNNITNIKSFMHTVNMQKIDRTITTTVDKLKQDLNNAIEKGSPSDITAVVSQFRSIQDEMEGKIINADVASLVDTFSRVKDILGVAIAQVLSDHMQSGKLDTETCANVIKSAVKGKDYVDMLVFNAINDGFLIIGKEDLWNKVGNYIVDEIEKDATSFEIADEYTKPLQVLGMYDDKFGPSYEPPSADVVKGKYEPPTAVLEEEKKEYEPPTAESVSEKKPKVHAARGDSTVDRVDLLDNIRHFRAEGKTLIASTPNKDDVTKKDQFQRYVGIDRLAEKIGGAKLVTQEDFSELVQGLLKGAKTGYNEITIKVKGQRTGQKEGENVIDIVVKRDSKGNAIVNEELMRNLNKALATQTSLAITQGEKSFHDVTIDEKDAKGETLSISSAKINLGSGKKEAFMQPDKATIYHAIQGFEIEGLDGPREIDPLPEYTTPLKRQKYEPWKVNKPLMTGVAEPPADPAEEEKKGKTPKAKLDKIQNKKFRNALICGALATASVGLGMFAPEILPAIASAPPLVQTLATPITLWTQVMANSLQVGESATFGHLAKQLIAGGAAVAFATWAGGKIDKAKEEKQDRRNREILARNRGMELGD